jgi:cysteine desulfurase
VNTSDSSKGLPSREALKGALGRGAAGDSIYCDWNATAPLRREAFEAMRPFLDGEAAATFGNAASLHRQGQAAKAALERARRTCAEALGCSPEEIVFTSGGTEANYIALRGMAWAARKSWDEAKTPGMPRLAASRIEHAAVHEALRGLQRGGFELAGDGHSNVGAGASGQVDPAELLAACDERTAVVTLMLANNETGAVQPVAELARLLDKRFGTRPGRGWPRLHVDAVQAAGKLALKVDALGCDTLAISAHKFEGPKGVGLLYVRRGVGLDAPIGGGGHEGGYRGGTPNVAGAAGMAEALRLAEAGRESSVARVTKLRSLFEDSLRARVGDAVVHGGKAERIGNTSFVSFPGLDGPALVLALDAEGVSCSTGAACSEGVGRPSHVLDAMGVPVELGRAAVRFSFGRLTTEYEVHAAVERVGKVAGRMRGA